MWNTKFASKSYERYYSFKNHKEHIERLTSIKPIIDTQTPKDPSFLHNPQIKYCINREKHLKADYDNRNLYGKMVDIDRHYSEYSKQKNSPLFTFSTVKSQFKAKTIHRTIDRENLKMHKRLHSSKTSYSNNSLRAHYRYNCYLNKQIRNCVPNPRMNYATLNQFKKHLSVYLKRGSRNSKNIPIPSYVGDEYEKRRVFTANEMKRSNYTPYLSLQNQNYYTDTNYNQSNRYGRDNDNNEKGIYYNTCYD